MTTTETGQLRGMRSERDAMPSRGAKFFREADDSLSFVFVIDSGNVIGPRPATKADSEKHPEAWAEFVAGDVPEVIEVVPDAIERDDAPAEPVTIVEPKDMAPFAERLDPPPPAPVKRKYTRRAVA